MTSVLEAEGIAVGALQWQSEAVFEPHPNMGGRAYIPNHVTLCSIFPARLEKFMLHAGMRKCYFIPEVETGKYALLTVYDTFQVTRKFAESSEDEAEDTQRSPVSCVGIATDLLRLWAQDAPGNASGSSPGIMVIQGSEPTQMELDTLWAQQTEYFRWLVMKADEYWIIGKREYITEDHRRALRWLGSEDRDWYKKINAVQFKTCPACGEDIRLMATVCPKCQENLVKFYKESGITVTEKVDFAVFRFMEMQRANLEALTAPTPKAETPKPAPAPLTPAEQAARREAATNHFLKDKE